MNDEKLADLVYVLLHFDPVSMTEEQYNEVFMQVEDALPEFFELRGDELVTAKKEEITAAIREHKGIMRVFEVGASTIIRHPYGTNQTDIESNGDE